MKHIALLFLSSLGSVALASGVEDALHSVQDAQRANDEGPACKGLSTKLKISIEAIEQAAKAPARIEQAKGRVETAKDFASSSCSGPVKDKVVAALTAAVSSLAKAAEPPPKEHKGAAIKATCRTNDECASEHCYVGAGPDGYCTKECEAPSDCPAQWQCRRLGSLPFKLCTP